MIPVQEKCYCGLVYFTRVPEAKVMDLQAKVRSALSYQLQDMHIHAAKEGKKHHIDYMHVQLVCFGFFFFK